jgi:hypothetical protein
MFTRTRFKLLSRSNLHNKALWLLVLNFTGSPIHPPSRCSQPHRGSIREEVFSEGTDREGRLVPPDLGKNYFDELQGEKTSTNRVGRALDHGNTYNSSDRGCALVGADSAIHLTHSSVNSDHSAKRSG